MRDLLMIWAKAIVALACWAALAGALDQLDSHNLQCSVVRCT